MRKKYWLLIITIFIFSVSIINLATAVAPTDYVSYYDFNTGSGTTLFDQNETNNNDGTINGMTWSSTVPSYNISGNGNPYSGSFDGSNDYVSGYSISSSDLSISLWVKTTQ